MKSRVVVAAVIEKDGKILMGERRDDIGPYPNTIQIPEGGVNLGEESLTDAIAREVREETGLEIKHFEQVGFDEDYEKNKHGELTHYIFLTFKAISQKDEIIAGDDLIRLAWYSMSSLKDFPLARPSQSFSRS